MLVFLDHSLLRSLASNPSQLSTTAIAIDLAAEAARQGTHILCGEIATFDTLIAHTNIFSERTRWLLARARTKLPFRQALSEGTKWHVKITTDVLAPTSHVIATGQTEVLLPPATLATHATLLQPPRFIPENNNDGHFFEALTYCLIDQDADYKSHFSTVKLHFDLTQGGGSTTGPVYAHAKASKSHFCLAVVDSDQTYPNGPIGPTATAVIAVDNPPNLPEWNARALVLGVRAVENLFPRNDLLKAADELDTALGETALRVVEAHAGRPQWNYLHLKKGVRCFDIKPANTPAGKFLRDATAFGGCPNLPPNACADREKCHTTVISALGDKLLAKICSKKPIQLSLDLIQDALLLPHIRQLCDEMISAFCGDTPALGE